MGEFLITYSYAQLQIRDFIIHSLNVHFVNVSLPFNLFCLQPGGYSKTQEWIYNNYILYI